MNPYPAEIEERMQELYQHLPEQYRRLYAAIEAQKLPHGGQSYIASLFDCSRNTVAQGIEDLHHLHSLPKERLRREGGGAKLKIETIPDIDEKFLQVVQEHIGGSPQTGKLWTNLSLEKIAAKLKEKGISLTGAVVKQLLKKHHFGRRKASKTKKGGECAFRDEQFRKIAQLKKRYEVSENALLSIDGKKKNR
jgi:hypothetical protein